ncbi:hypothetical protein [Pseudobdellovibrio exovorus]|uniref:Uncharacterized protein n=1 Tax=Pseudobdellovibrio exovorus JSS TaxID=1184267 RepID=M4VAZ9_9BACT|nr:hypothetical protein [Pseudobdellovibrio exovorus]AGH95650.1 hypothetical protein A11Q_1434 [Pseudobdellovibrio exovorus JSS]
MRVKVHYRHISYSVELTQNITEWLEEQLPIGQYASQLHIDLFFSKSTPYSKPSLVVFECHLRARAPWLSSEIFVKDQNEDFWGLVTSCGAMLKRQIMRDLSQRRSSQRQSHRWQQPPTDYTAE